MSKEWWIYDGKTWTQVSGSGGGGGTSDFNSLTNRPKYNGAFMTGSTSIPEVPDVSGKMDTPTTAKTTLSDSDNIVGISFKITWQNIKALLKTYFDGIYGTYSKPANGIPKTDLASAVQASLDLADSALQTHQDISGKQDTSNLVTAVSSASTDAQYPSAKCLYDICGNVETALDTINDALEAMTV